MGLPIGPDTSLLLAEIILCAIDVELEEKVPQTSRFCFRMMDDLEFSAESRGEAEDVLLQWESLLSGYSLTLNPVKTDIIEGPVSPLFPWQVQLAQFNLRYNSDRILANDIQSLFSLAFAFAKENPNEAVLSYTVNRVRPRPDEPKSWKAFMDLLLGAVVTDPSSLVHASSALNWAAARGLPIDLTSVAETMDRMCLYHAPLEHGSEVAWSLSIMRDFDLPLSSECASRVAAMRDNCSLLLLLDFIARSRVGGSVPDISDIVSRAEGPEAWKSEDWLLGYECARNGWASDKFFLAQDHWGELLKLGVPFFATVPTTPSVQTQPTLTLTPPQGAPSSPSVDDEEEAGISGHAEDSSSEWEEVDEISYGE